MDTLLVIVATCMTILAAFFYNRNVLKGTGKPNLSTWGIWILIQILNFVTYFSMSNDWLKSVNAIINTLSTISIFSVSVLKGNFSRPNKWDIGVFCLGLCIAALWFANRNSGQANVLLQIATAIGFIPTVRGIWKDSSIESLKPWIFFTLGHAISIGVVCLRWQGKNEELVFPIIQMFLNVSVILAIKYSPSNK